MKRFYLFILAACAAFPLAGCVTSSEVHAKLQGQQWAVATYNDGLNLRPVLRNSAYVSFLPDGTLSGSPGCGQFVGSYRIEGPLITISTSSAIGGSGCQGDALAQDAQIVNAFDNASRVSLGKDQITITDLTGNVQVILIPMAK